MSKFKHHDLALLNPSFDSPLVDLTFQGSEDVNNESHPDKYDLMKVALAHHRFGWVHPFGNGNGRVVRLLTYAQLIQYDFSMATVGRVINPTAVFCNDRDKYYECSLWQILERLKGQKAGVCMY